MIDPKNLAHRQNLLVKDVCSSLVNGKILYANVGIIDGNFLYSAFSDKNC